jgi:hypothetical protein
MTRTTLLVIGLLGSLAVTTAVANENGYGAVDSIGRSADGQQTSEGPRTIDGGTVPIAVGEAATEKGEAETIPLPTTLCDAALSLECEDKIRDTLQTDPERFRPWETVGFAVEETAKRGDHAHHGVE